MLIKNVKSKIGTAAVVGSTYLMASGANAAIDVSAAVAEITDGKAALGTLGLAAIVFAGAAFAIFAVFRRIPK